MKCEVRPIELALHRDFIVAGGRERLKRNCLLVIEGIGLGEAAGSVQYGPTPDEIERDLRKIAAYLADVQNGDAACHHDIAGMGLCPPALCAFSTAWHDWKCKASRRYLYEQFGLPPPHPVDTSVTVSVGDRKALAEWQARGYRRIKVKMAADHAGNEPIVAAMTAADKGLFRIDANGSWTYDMAARLLERLPRDRIELIEQPFPSAAADDWHRLRGAFSIPLFMDESICTADDVKSVAGYVDGVNIKLQKSGLLETAAAAVDAARDAGLMVMLGCMIESSVGIAAAYQFSGIADYCDLDGRLLIRDDPFSGLAYENGNVIVSGEFGHGVSLA